MRGAARPRPAGAAACPPRLGGSAIDGQAHLKTGLLNNVRGLAGYVLDKQGRRVVLVVLHNHAQADGNAGRVAQEAVLDWVYNRP